jgi:hypothetical protein
MGRVTSALSHLSELEVSVRLKQTTGREHRRWLIIWNALVGPRPAPEIAFHTDVSISCVNSHDRTDTSLCKHSHDEPFPGASIR